MARKKKETKKDVPSNVEVWKLRLTMAKNRFDTEIKEDLRRYRSYYKGRQWGEQYVSRRGFSERLVDNMVFSNIQTIIPSINFSHPVIYVSPKRKPFQTEKGPFNTIVAAKKFEMLLDYYYGECKVKKTADRVLLDALLGPWGIAQVGYFADIKKTEGNDQTPQEILEREGLYVQRIAPEDFLVDPEAVDPSLKDAKWVAVRWVKRKSEMEDSGLYGDLSEIENNYTVPDSSKRNVNASSSRRTGGDSQEWGRIEGWDVWDGENKRLITIVMEHDGVLRDVPWPLDYDGYPFETLFFNSNPDSLFPISDVGIYMSSQDALNAISSYELEHIRKISRRRYLTKQGAMTGAEKDKLMYGEDGVVAETAGDPNTSFMTVSDANISQDMRLAKNDLKENIRLLAGTSQFEQGVPEKFDTATEPNLMAQGTSIKRNHRRAIFEDFLVRVVSKMASVAQQTIELHEMPLSPDKYKQMAKADPASLVSAPATQYQFLDESIQYAIGGDGQEAALLPWLSVKKSDIEGDYFFDVEMGSTLPENKETRKQEAATLWNMLVNNPSVNQEWLIQQQLDAFDLKDADGALVPEEQKQMSQQGQQQQEMIPLQMKQQTDLAKTKMKTDTAITLAEIKAKTEQMRMVHSEASLKTKSRDELIKMLLEHDNQHRLQSDAHGNTVQQSNNEAVMGMMAAQQGEPSPTEGMM